MSATLDTTDCPHNAVAGGVGRVLLDRQLGLVVQDAVQHVGRVTNGGADDAGGVVGVLIARPDVERDAAAAAEVSRNRAGFGRVDADGVALAVAA